MVVVHVLQSGSAASTYLEVQYQHPTLIIHMYVHTLVSDAIAC